MVSKNLVILVCSLCCLSSCASIGPRQMELDREAYNDIVRQTDYEQILKNIVRLRYAEPTSYLKVTSVTASYQITRSISGTLSGNTAGSNNYEVAPTTSAGALSISPSASYSDAPTISYVPINDAAFVAALQQPIDFHDIALLVKGGISDNELIMRLVFDWVGPLDNASSAANSIVKTLPEYQQYYQFIGLLVTMLNNHELYIDPVEINHSKAGIIIDFNGESYKSTQALAMKRLLGIAAGSQDIVLTNQNIYNLKMNNNHELREENSDELAKNLVFVQMRSLNAMMTFLAHSVQVPESDIQAGYTPELNQQNKQPFDWQPLMRGLMTVLNSDSEPQNVFIKTKVNGHWFYIKKSDIDSKLTFTLLVSLMTMKAGLGVNNAQTSPLITVPVGAGAH